MMKTFLTAPQGGTTAMATRPDREQAPECPLNWVIAPAGAHSSAS
jgi:hypothetical protein